MQRHRKQCNGDLLPIADTTTTTWLPQAAVLLMRSATLLIRSVVPTDVPPYFCTIIPISTLHLNNEKQKRQQQGYSLIVVWSDTQ
jgi:hypothetical protein